MSRRRQRKHEEHANHEAWAIPYGDLVTLLLAFFVVMYAISSVNEGKYRVLSDSMVSAFGGTPKTIAPLQIGDQPILGNSIGNLGAAQPIPPPTPVQLTAPDPEALALRTMAEQLTEAMSDLIDQELVVVRRSETYVEVEIRTDILYASGSAELNPKAIEVIRLLGQTLAPFPNDIRVEGYTDDRPIRSAAFRSNWELSAGRAASVVHVMMEAGLPGPRLSVLAYGEHRPVAPNDTEAGRNANRRVVLVIAGAPSPRTTTANQVAAR
jgi:chemotaxis protein MotB